MSLGYIDSKKLMEELNISKSTLYRFMYDYDEKIPFIKMKRKILFNKEKVLEWLEGREIVDENDELKIEINSEN